MSLRKSFSGFRKKAKDKLSKIGGRTEEIRADAGDRDSGLYRPASRSQSEPAIVVEDEFKGDPEAGGGGGDSGPGGSLVVSRSAAEIGPVQGGSDDKPSGEETCQQGLHPHSDVQAESGSSHEERIVGGEHEAGRADLPQPGAKKETTPTTSIPRAGASEGMGTTNFNHRS